jgi:hypothetical protein
MKEQVSCETQPARSLFRTIAGLSVVPAVLVCIAALVAVLLGRMGDGTNALNLPIKLCIRGADSDPGYVLIIGNYSEKVLPLRIALTSPTFGTATNLNVTLEIHTEPPRYGAVIGSSTNDDGRLKLLYADQHFETVLLDNGTGATNGAPDEIDALLDALPDAFGKRMQFSPPPDGRLTIGKEEGWNFASGDLIKISSHGYRTVSLKVP